MKRFKGIFLVLVIILLSLGLASNTYARERAGENDREHSSRGRSSSRREKESGPRLNYDGRTSGIGNRVGGIAGTAAGGTIGSRIGGAKGGLAGGYIDEKIPGKEEQIEVLMINGITKEEKIKDMAVVGDLVMK